MAYRKRVTSEKNSKDEMMRTDYSGVERWTWRNSLLGDIYTDQAHDPRGSWKECGTHEITYPIHPKTTAPGTCIN